MGLYGTAVVLLAAVPAVGITANSATRGSVSAPSAPALGAGQAQLLLVLAAVLGSARPAWQRSLAVLLAAVPIGLTLVQPDLSTTTPSPFWPHRFVIGRIPARFLLPLVAAATISAPLVIGLLRPYQVERLKPSRCARAPTGSGWAVRQANIAIGSGTLFGRTDDPCGSCAPSTCPGARPTWPWRAWSGGENDRRAAPSADHPSGGWHWPAARHTALGALVGGGWRSS